MKILSFVSDILDTLGEIVSGFADVVVSIFNSVVGVFYTPGVDGAEGQITFVGGLLLFAAGTSLVIWGINWVRRLIRVRTN